MILVAGGTGFVGREVVKQLLATGHSVRVLARDLSAKNRNEFKSCDVVAGDILDRDSLDGAMDGVQAVINLVGIIAETKGASFEQIHVQGTRNLVQAARGAGVKRFLQMSAINTRSTSLSGYHQTKWKGEDIVRNNGLDWTIIQPSVIYGPGDGFVSRFADMMQAPLCYATGCSIPYPGDTDIQLQPVHVENVASAFVNALCNEKAIGQIYELGGDPISLHDLLESIARTLGLNPATTECSFPAAPFVAPLLLARGFKPVLIPVPDIFFRAVAGIMELLCPLPILTLDQAIMLEESHHANTYAAEHDLGFKARSIKEELPKYLV